MSVTSAKSGATGISLALDNNYMEPIATTVVGSTTVNSVIFSDIPQTYKHLQIRCIVRDTNAAASAASLALRFNTETTNYTFHALQGNGSSVTASGATSYTYAYNGLLARNGLTNGIMSVNIIDILDYANTDKYKTIRGLGGYDANGSGYVGLYSNVYQSTTAISQIHFYTDDSANFTQYSRFSLYGIKG